MDLAGKQVILGVTGSIAAYKAVYLLRLLIKEGAQVQVIMTPTAKEFVGPVTFSALSGKTVLSEFFQRRGRRLEQPCGYGCFGRPDADCSGNSHHPWENGRRNCR